MYVFFETDKHLSADGVHYFVTILESSRFTYIDWPRQFANYLIEWPLVLAVMLGSDDTPRLIDAFALGIYLPYAASFFISAYVLRGEGKSLLIFPLYSYLLINMAGQYFLAGEHHVMSLLAWPILFLLVKRSPLTIIEVTLLLGLLTLFIRLLPECGNPGCILFDTLSCKRNSN